MMHSPPASPPASAIELELQFPDHLSESISTILAETNLHAMDDAASDTTHDSLSESTYEIISHSSLTNSDDESSALPDTESLASFGDTGLEYTSKTHDVHPSDYSGQEKSHSGDEQVEYQEEEKDSSPPTPYEHSEHQGYQKDLQSSSGSSFSFTTIRSPSHHDLNQDNVDVVHTVGYPSEGGLQTTIRQTLSAKKLRLGDPFHIIYHGDPAQCDKIIEKIAQALTLSATVPAIDDQSHSPAISRHSVVQLSSFGDSNSSPQIELIPSSGIEIEVEICKTCSQAWMDYQPQIFNAKGTVRDSGTPKGIDDVHTHYRPSRPVDLAVYYHTASTLYDMTTSPSYGRITSLERSRKDASSGVPTLDVIDKITQVPDRFRPFKDQAVHMCFEVAGEPVTNTAYRVISRRPIDLPHFLDLDAEQLNRNIACITSSRLARPCTKKLIRNTLKPFWIGSSKPQWNFVLGLVLLFLYLGIQTFQSTSTRKLSVESSGPIIMDLTPSNRTDLSFATSSCDRLNGPTSDLTVGPLSPADLRPVVKESETFRRRKELPLDIFTSSRGDFFLKVPETTSQIWDRSRFVLFAEQSGAAVPTYLEKCNASLWSLQLYPSDGKNSNIEVTIVTESHPYRQRTFTIKREASFWRDMSNFESSIRSKSKEISKAMKKELDVFRRITTSVAIYSSDWIKESFCRLQDSSSNVLGESWKRLQRRQQNIALSLYHQQISLYKQLISHITVATRSIENQCRNVKDDITGQMLRTKLLRAIESLHHRIKNLQENIQNQAGGLQSHANAALVRAKDRANKLREKLRVARQEQHTQKLRRRHHDARKRKSQHSPAVPLDLTF